MVGQRLTNALCDFDIRQAHYFLLRWRAFPNACHKYQKAIGTRYEACAIKYPENKSAVVFPSVFQTPRKSTALCFIRD
ncbi:thiol peroxidase [Aggregatibacter aphrophilus NJ8700]|nr:thiol peroxidase [Aggregatibacter aphrophilus NJ8700]